jgi:hypothetical protein
MLFAAPAVAVAAKDPLADLHRAIRAFMTAVAVKQDFAAAMRWADAGLATHELMKVTGCLLSSRESVRDRVEDTLRQVFPTARPNWRAAVDEKKLPAKEELARAGLTWDSRWTRDGYMAIHLTAAVIDKLRRSGEADETGLRTLAAAASDDQAMVLLPLRGMDLALLMIWRRSPSGWRFIVLSPACD